MNKMQKLAKDALDVQDACNAVAVCKGFDRVLTQLRELGVSWASETMSERSSPLTMHPISRLWAHKLADLFGMADVGSDLYSEAYQWCMDMVPTKAQIRIRQDIRSFLLVATKDELEKELKISHSNDDQWRASCVLELLEEHAQEDAKLGA